MFSLFGGRKQYYESRSKNNDAAVKTPAKGSKTERAGIEDSGIVVDNQNQVPISPFGTNSYAVDDGAPSELSSGFGGSSYQQQFPDTPSNEPSTTEPSTTPSQQQQQQLANNSNMKVPNQRTMQQQQKLSPHTSNGVHAISYVTQAPEHGYTAGQEDDLSTLGDESIIRRGRRGKQQLLKQQQQAQQQKSKIQKRNSKNLQTNPSYDKTKIVEAHTRSTEEISPSNASKDLSYSFSNVLDVNEKIPDSSRLGYEVTDYSLTDRGPLDGEDGDSKDEEEEEFLQRNKWTIIKFMVGISLFLLMAAAAVLVVSLLHMRSVATESEALTTNGDYYASSDSNDDVNGGMPSMLEPLVPVPKPTEPLPPDTVVVVNNDPTTTSPTAKPTTSPTAKPTFSPTGSPTSASTTVATTAFPLVDPWADFVSATDAPSHSQPTGSPISVPTSFPTLSTSAPISVPTSFPTSTTIESGSIVNTIDAAEQAKVGTDLRFVIANFSPTSLPLLEDPNSAQFKAFDWMTKDPSYWNYEISKIVQRWTLGVLYYSTGGANWQTENLPTTYAEGKSPWLSYSDECLWESSNQGTRGRICDSSNNLFAIHLRNVGLTGTLPAELSLLSDHMRLLFVNGNELTGTLPSELGRLTALEKVNLQYNNFSGSLPSEIGNWGAASIVSMGNNQFSGQIPPETGNWNSMVTIGFEKNMFSGTLPKEWADMLNIVKISIEHNSLTGTIPVEFNYMYELTSLSMQSNDITGRMRWGLCPGSNSVEELKADCSQVICGCCTECFTD